MIEQIYAIFQKYPIISIDSRTCSLNSIFFALNGPKFDGNDYISQALDKGASYVVGDKHSLPNWKQVIRVKNVLQTLQSLANHHRKQMNIQLIAITGTNGKTTTKELIASALSSKYRVLHTKENLNNHIGVPLTLLQLKLEHQIAVIEMGANHSNEIQRLCQIAEPNYGLITNIGRAHLEGFNSLQEVVKEKIQLYFFLRKKNGIAFINTDNLILKNQANLLSTVSYGTNLDSFISGKILESDPTLILEWYKKNGERNKIKTYLAGAYNFENVLASICIAHYFGVKEDEIKKSITEYIPVNHRSQNMKTNKNNLIIDSYNANPESMKAALDNFFSIKDPFKIIILGEMKELGKYAKKEHQKLLNNIFSKSICQLFLVGKNFENCIIPCSDWKLFVCTENLVEYLKNKCIKGYRILIKGSRSNQLEKIFPYL